jgi:hypothetical protein
MSKINVPVTLPSPLPEDRFAQNGDLPSTSALRRTAWAYNHAATHQRKLIYSMSHATQSTPAMVTTSDTTPYFVFRTGEAVESIQIIVGMAPASATHANPARCQVSLYDGTSTISTGDMVYNKVAAGTYPPSDVEWNVAQITAADGLQADTVYAGYLTQWYWARVHSLSIYERAKPIADTSTVGIADPLAWESYRPIYDEHVEDLCTTGTTLWKHNGSQLLSWGRKDGTSAPSITSTSWVNLLSTGITAWSSSSPGYMLSTLYHDSRKSDVPVELGVRAVRTAGSGTLDVKLEQTGGAILTQTGITDPGGYSPANTSAHTILAHAPTKTDIMVRVSSGTWRIDAVGLWEYLA